MHHSLSPQIHNTIYATPIGPHSSLNKKWLGQPPLINNEQRENDNIQKPPKLLEDDDPSQEVAARKDNATTQR